MSFPLRLFVLLTAVLVGAAAPSIAQAQIYVDADATGANDGTAWADAYTDLQDALDVATGSDEIWIAEGTYYPDEGNGVTADDRSASFTVDAADDGLEIYGGFSGGESNLDERNLSANETILSGDIDQDGTRSGNSYHVLFFDGDSTPVADFTYATANRTVDFTDQSTDDNGSIASYDWDFEGGGTATAQNPSYTYSANGTYTVTLSVTDNAGVTASITQEVTVSDASSNQAPQADFSSSEESCDTFDFTDASSDPDGTIASYDWDFGDGGTATAQDPSYTFGSDDTYTVTLTVTDDDGATDTETRDIVVSCGGSGDPPWGAFSTVAPAVTRATVTSATVLDGVTVTGGNANDSDASLAFDTPGNRRGGGLVCDGSSADGACTPTLRNLIFRGNHATDGGALVNFGGGTGGESSPLIENVVFTGNSAGYGGAVFNYAFGGGTSSPRFTNVVFSGNSADHFGGALFSGVSGGGTSSPVVTNVTFTGNSAGDEGGAVYSRAGGATSATEITNVILWSNDAPTGPEVYVEDASATVGHTILEGGLTDIAEVGSGSATGGSNLSSDPQFVDASDADGSDGVFATTDDGLRLLDGSPALGAGTSSGVTLPAEDLTGAARVQDAAVDLGAYEGAVAPTPDQALALDGTDDFARADAVSDALAGASAFTMEAWVYPTENTTDQQGLLAFNTATGGNRNLLVYTDQRVQYYDTESGFQDSRNRFPAGRWHHVAVTIDGADHGTLYVNGRREATFTTSVRPAGGGLFSMGQEYDGGGPTATDFFEGRIDEVRLWSEARTQSEIQAGMQQALGEANDLNGASGLAAHHRFEGTRLDATGTADATLVGDPGYEADVDAATADDRLVVRVDASAAGGGAGNGTTWTDAHAALQDGLAGTGPENEIRIAAGTYYPDEGASVTVGNRDTSFVLTGDQDGLRILGGYPAGGGPRDVAANETILSGDVGTAGDASDNSYHVLVFDGTTGGAVTTATVLDGVIVTGGTADGSGSNNNGGGLFCDGSGSGSACSPTLSGVIFTGNSADRGGGAIYNNAYQGESSPVITNALFIGNDGGSSGGAIYNNGSSNGESSPQITNTTFTDNSANTAGAIYSFGKSGGTSRPQFTNTILWGNTADGSPGQLNGFAGDPVITHSLVEGGCPSSADCGDGSTLIDADPLFSDPSNPDGADDTFGTDDDGLTLLDGSPALDAGSTAALDTTGNGTRDVTTDLTGGPRVVDNDNDGATPATVDLGAYEASSSTQLPVELVSFEATAMGEESVQVRWETASETGNAGFRIQRQKGGPVKPSRRDGSTEEEGWQTVGSIDGAGTTDEVQSYRFADEDLPYEADSLTYRLKQIDTDGSTSYSDPITVDRSAVSELELLGTYPNPARSQATIRFAVPESAGGQEVRLRLYDVMGRQVRTVRSEASSGRHSITLGTARLPSGVYFLRLGPDGQMKTQKLTVVQ